MITIKEESIWYFDVDSTLVTHDQLEVGGTAGDIEIVCPYTQLPVDCTPLLGNIRLLKEKAGRGSTVVVWSQGGALWAEAVIKALGLEDCVTLCITKPTGIVDDLSPVLWLPKTTFISGVYKNGR